MQIEIESILFTISHEIGLLVGAIGVCIILVGCVRAIATFLLNVGKNGHLLADLRIGVGQYLALGLEFLVAKDIIDTVLKPTWSDLGKLAVIIALRTAITIFLAYEVKGVRKELEEENTIRKLAKMRG
jgi:uncharacterized membrane protein